MEYGGGSNVMIDKKDNNNTRAHSPRLNNKLTAICHVSRRTRTTCCSTLRTLLRFNAFCLTLAYCYNSPLHNVWITIQNVIPTTPIRGRQQQIIITEYYYFLPKHNK